jgi:predicted transcriptional regulator
VEKRLDRLAEQRNRAKSLLAGEAIADFVDRELSILDGIKRGLADMAAGRVVPHRKAMRRLRATVNRVSKNARKTKT